MYMFNNLNSRYCAVQDFSLDLHVQVQAGCESRAAQISEMQTINFKNK